MEFLSLMEMIGTIAFAITGALVAIEKKLDYYGICFLAIITAVGGGIVRDLIINLKIPVAIHNPTYVVISVITAIFVILFYKHIVHFENWITLFDALGLAAFSALGCQAAVAHGFYQPFIILTLAVLTGTGGGMIRDICAGRVPFIFHGEIYAVASLLGAMAYIIVKPYSSGVFAMYICFIMTFIFRFTSVKCDMTIGKVKKERRKSKG